MYNNILKKPPSKTVHYIFLICYTLKTMNNFFKYFNTKKDKLNYKKLYILTKSMLDLLKTSSLSIYKLSNIHILSIYY